MIAARMGACTTPTAGIVPHIMLPSQLRPRAPVSPSRRLAAAVFEDAVTSYQRALHLGPRHPGCRALVLECEVWFGSDDRGWPYSFRNLCAHLGIEPTRARAAFVAMRDSSTWDRVAA